MRKYLVLLVAFLFSVTMVSTAFAGSSGFVTYDKHGSSGWVSDGQHGHYWSGFDGPVLVKGKYADSRYYNRDCDYRYSRSGSWYSYKDSKGKLHYYRDRDNDGAWYYYIDDNGKKRYIYVDPDRDGEWKHYYDKNGHVQYYYDVR
ncbi:hypothetical protein SPSYN_02805 [Sporotomaculum syntrophicum]|uniref:Cell wall binding repeat protein n=1 Tax=Sporotomaculum syntrophicum TaxID=182264 RepID=A0A9D3AXQ5_9FIRM|nr:hypothetical protein [Sporotomaculum syntrophicum]KAF1083893.1 hypothetical protein SPSYN_02805 [Sporotomaculum syntrophicum]